MVAPKTCFYLAMHEPKHPSPSALRRFAIAQISSRLARISSSMHIVFSCRSYKTDKMEMSIPHFPAGFKREMRFWGVWGLPIPVDGPPVRDFIGWRASRDRQDSQDPQDGGMVGLRTKQAYSWESWASWMSWPRRPSRAAALRLSSHRPAPFHAPFTAPRCGSATSSCIRARGGRT